MRVKPKDKRIGARRARLGDLDGAVKCCPKVSSPTLLKTVRGVVMALHLLTTLSVGRVWVARVAALSVAGLVHLVHATGILTLRNLPSGGSVADGREVGTGSRRVGRAGRCLRWVAVLTIGGASTGGGSLTVILGFARVVFLLLAGLPFLPDLFELYLASASAFIR